MGGVPLPEGYHSVNPYIVVDDAERLIHFLVEVFGAVEQGRALRPDGRIDHGDVRIGDSLVMLSEASEAYPARPCVHFVYVPDVDATYRAALAAGATSILAPTEQRWGDRTCGFVDPFDNRWWVATICESSPRPTTFRLRDGCSASTWMAPDGSRLLTLDAPSVQTAQDGSRPIVWMIIGMIKAHPTNIGSKASNHRWEDSVCPNQQGALAATHGGTA